jgi:transcription elongation factor Elf1
MEASSEIPKMDKRIVTRGGVTYKQDTSNIGSTPTRPDVSSGEHVTPVRQGEATETRQPDNGPHTEPTAQAFECPRCGQEKIVGVNDRRFWCLACDAEWSTVQEFLAEVTIRLSGQPGEVPSRAQLRTRFMAILARLDDEKLAEVAAWLAELERRLAEPAGQPAARVEAAISLEQLEKL